MNPTGADGLLGYNSPTSDGSDDNFHLQSTVGSFKGASSAPIVNAGTGLPYFPAGTLSADANQSPAIDRGSPNVNIGAEPAPNGNFINLGWDGGTSLASESPSQYVLVTKPAGGETLPIGQLFPIKWRSQDNNSTVTIDLLQGASSTPILNIATGVANNGEYDWTVPNGIAAANNYYIRVTRADLPGSPGISLAPFSIAAATTVFYVNNGTVVPGGLATAPGNDANDGLTPATPKATITGLLAAYTLGAGDIIMVDAGTYILSSNIALPLANSGLTIEGYNNSAYPNLKTVLNRNNTTGGSDVFDLTGATNVTLEYLGITGGYYGVNATNSANSTGFTIENCDVSDYYTGITLGTSETGAVILNNNIHDNSNGNSGNTGLYILAGGATISGNLFKNDNIGVNMSAPSGTLTGNTATANFYGFDLYGSGGAGIIFSNNIAEGNTGAGVTVSTNVQVTNNQIYDNNYPYYGGATGLVLNGGATASGNYIFDNNTGVNVSSGTLQGNFIYHNTGIAINESGSTILGNQVYSNGVALSGASYSLILRNNLFYLNTAGVSLSGGSGGLIDSNTIDQPSGDAFDLSGTASSTTVRDNIFITSSGYVENIAANSETAFASDYNDLYAAGTASLLLWGSQPFTTMASIYYELGLEQHGQSDDPQFANPVGPDGILGFSTTSVGSPTIIDNGQTGYSEIGTWTTVTGGLNGTHRQAATGNNTASATYTFTGLTPGDYYQIAATWIAESSGYGASVYTGLSGYEAPLAVTVNQNVASQGFSDGTTVWQPFGYYRADTSTITVTLSGSYVNLEADGVRVQQIQGNGGADDSFVVQSTSLTIDAGAPTEPFSLEPVPNGGRANLGNTGDTFQAATSPAQSVQITSPTAFAKLTVGQQAILGWNTSGLPQTAAPIQTVIAQDAPQAYYRFDEASGTTAADSSGNGQNAAYVGNPTLGVSGAPVGGTDTAIQDASGQYVKLPSGFANFNGGLTFEVWADPTSVGSNQRFFDLGNGSYSDNIVLARVSTTNNLIFTIYRGTSIVTSVTATGVIALNTWQDYAVTMDASGNVAIYVNGQIVATGNGPLPNIVTRTSNFIGHSNFGDADYVGKLDEASIYNYALPGDQLYAHYASVTYANVQINLLQNGTLVQTIAASAPDSDRFAWTVPNLPGSGYEITVTANLPALPSGTSLSPFQIVAAGNNYYVSPTGDDNNTGKSIDSPMASLTALFQAYSSQFVPGTIINLATGTYNLTQNIVLNTQENGITFQGPMSGPLAILNRANTSGGDYVFQLAGAINVTLDHLEIIGGYEGVYAPNNTYSTGLKISNSNISDYYVGVDIEATNTGAMILNNDFHDNANGNSGNAGLIMVAEGSTITGNLFINDNTGLNVSAGSGVVTGNTATLNFYGFEIFGGSGVGITVSNNVAAGNTGIGLYCSNNVQITNNQIYDNHYLNSSNVVGLSVGGSAVASNNSIFDNDVGVNISGGVLQNNRIYNNTGAGVNVSGSSTVSGNTIYNNGVGIKGSSYYMTIRNNLIYQNATGITLSSGSNGLLDSNTIYQLSGDGFDLSGSASYMTLRDNIIDVQSNYAVNVSADSQIGFVSDYNFYSINGTGTLGLWGGVGFASMANWYYELGLDQHSQSGNPQFVNLVGADGVLGFSTATTGSAIIIDNGQAGYSETGTWTTASGGLNGSHRQVYSSYPSYSYATYTFTGLTPGDYYQAAGTWAAEGSGYGSTVYTVQSGVEAQYSTTVNQNVASQGFNDGVATWQPFGVFRADTSTMTVTVGGTNVNIEADGVRLQQALGDRGADDNFNVQSTSPTIDAGSLLEPFSAEPAPNGGRANVGYTGDTAQATNSASALIQVVSPSGLEKLAVGQQVNITWRNSGLAGTSAPLASVIAEDTPSAYYRLNEASGATAADSSGNGLNASYVGNPTLGVPGTPVGGSDSAIQVASGQYVKLPTGFANFTGGLTFEIWAYPTSVANDQRFFDLGNGAYSDNIVLARSGTTNNLIFQVYHGSSVVTSVTANGVIALNTWQDFAVTMDALGNVNLYVNGQVVATGNGPLPNVVTRANNFIGHSNFSAYGDADFIGKLGEASLFNSALPADRMLDHYQSMNTGTVLVNLLQNGQVAQTIATAAVDDDKLTWTVPNLVGSGYQISITSSLAGVSAGLSPNPFQIVPAGNVYYVSPTGNDLNTGTTPDQPLASVAAVLQAFQPGSGATIQVAAGTYTLYHDLVLLPVNSGLTIQGPAQAGAILNRANINTSCYGIDVEGATNVTLSGLTITGALGGVNIPQNDGSNSLTLTNSVVFGNQYFGVYAGSGNSDVHILNNTIYNNANGNAYTYGLQVYGQRDVASGNQTYGQVYGIDASYSGIASDAVTITGNTVRSNSYMGIQAANDVVVSNNTVYGQTASNGYGIYAYSGTSIVSNIVYGNTDGIYVNSTATGNRVFDNNIGILANSSSIIQANKVYSNQIGIEGTSFSGYIENNIVYVNTAQSILITNNSNGAKVVNNTIYQPVGDDVDVQSSSSNVQVESNILYVLTGNALHVTADSTSGLVSLNNITTNPLFVDPAGADGVLGYNTANGYDGGADDNFYVSQNSPAIDHGVTWAAPATDALGYGRSDDPATQNTGTNDYFPATPANPSVYSTPLHVGVAQNWKADDQAWTLPLPFPFPFYGSSYNSVQVSSNGFLQFAGSADPTSPANSDAALISSVRIAGLWADLTTANSGDDIYVDSTLTGQITIRWAAQNKADGSPVNFEITLFNTGAFQVDYGAGNVTAGATVGFSSGDGTHYTLSSLDGQTNLNFADSFNFTPVASQYRLTPLASNQFASTGTPINLNADEGTATVTFPAGFTFPFYGIGYTSVKVTPNGVIYFNSDPSYSGSDTALKANRMIAVAWADLTTTTAGDNIFVDTTVAGQVTIRWQAHVYNSTIQVNASATLFANGTIQLNYGSGNAGVAFGVGISAGNNLNYVLGGNYDQSTNLTNANSIQFLPPPSIASYTQADVVRSAFNSSEGVAQNWKADNQAWTLTLPFAFPFYSSIYSSVQVSSNGFLQFAGGGDPTSSANSDAALIANTRIAARWANLTTAPAGDDIYVDTSTTGQVTIRWAAQNVADNSAVNFSITLYNTGAIRLDYGAGNKTAGATVGISSGDGSHYTLSTLDGSTNLNNADSQSFSPSIQYNVTSLPTSQFAATGIAINLNADEGTSIVNFPAGFAFPFYGVSYTSVKVTPNGVIYFNTDPSYNSSDTLLKANRMIAVAWRDLTTTAAGDNVFVDTTVAGQVTIRWAAHVYGTSIVVNASATLFSSGAIQFNYGSGNTDPFVVGISAGDGLNYTIGGGLDGAPNLTNANSLLFSPPAATVYAAADLGPSQFSNPGGTAQNWHSDDSYWQLNLPFSFPFYDGTYSSVYVSSNGFLQFGSYISSGNSANDTGDFLANRRMAPLWADLRTDLTGDDIYVNTSIANQVTIRWVATAKSTGGPVNFAVTLYSNGQFRFDYGAGNANLAPTVGVSYGNGVAASYSPGFNAAASLAVSGSTSFALQPGYVDVGAYEFRGSSSDTTPFLVTGVTPVSVANGVAAGIRIDFGKLPNPIDASAPANYQLRDAGPDGIFGTPDDHYYQITPQYAQNTSYVILNVSGGVPLNRVYQLTVVGYTMHDVSGLQLSGAGTPGTNLLETGLLGLPGVAVNPTSLSLQAGGASVQVSIALSSPPTANVTIVLDPGSQLSVVPNTLTFTPANWNVPQMVNVSALATASGPGSLNFNLTSSDIRYQGFSVAPLPAAVALETTTTLTSSASPAELAQVVTLSATVAAAPGSATPTGNVQFLDGANSLGTAALSANGVATLTISSFALGAHSLSAVYLGDAYDQGSTSHILSEMIGKDLVTATVNSSENPSSFGQVITFTANVSSAGPLSGPATGMITFYDSLDGGMQAPLFTTALVNGTATFTSSSLAVGTHGVTVVYSGDASFAAGASASALNQVVNTASTTTMLVVAPPVSTVGTPVTFTATVMGASPSGGTVSFFLDGAGTPFGTATANNAGVATFTTSTLAVGAHSITASYAGDANNAASPLSAPVTEQVNASGTAPTVTSVLINGGQVQRSMVTSIQLTFNEAVDPLALANAFTLMRVKQVNGVAGDNAVIGNIHVAVSSDASGHTIATLTFSGANTEGSSLADGNWTLTVDHNSVVSNGVHATTDYMASNIKRLFGDFNGTNIVDSSDLGLLGTTFSLTSSNPAFLAMCDSDGNGVIDSIDLGRFGINFGSSI